ncbi:MAG: hypothetical protein M3R63_18510 [Actinomycetota bacterium]|nr:hypothetical protein [Actinomycetota bacterium]
MKARIALLGLVAVMVACGPGAKERALRTTLTGVNAARAAFVTWDGLAQDRIVEEATSLASGQHELEQHRAKRAALVAAFEGAYFALAIAATDRKDHDLASAALAAAKLYALYRALVGDDPPKESP